MTATLTEKPVAFSDGFFTGLASRTKYTFDNVGNRTSVAGLHAARTTYGYDRTYQLTNEHRWGPLAWESLTVDQWDRMTADDWSSMLVPRAGAAFNVTYTYDPVGNRLVQEDRGTRTTYTYDDANELLTSEDSAGVTTYTYDATGNRRTKEEPATGVTTYNWDPQDRLTSAVTPDADRHTFTYNAAGQRVVKETDAGVAKFVRDFNRILLETDGNDTTQVLYTASLGDFGNLISEYDQSDSSFHLYDALGSTDAITNADQATTDSYAYRAFGQLESQAGSSTSPFTFVGRQGYFYEPALGLYYVAARWYDPTASALSGLEIGVA